VIPTIQVENDLLINPDVKKLAEAVKAASANCKAARTLSFKLATGYNNSEFTTVNLSEWVAGGSASVFASTLNVPVAALDDAPTDRVFIGKKRPK
jgi:hypothetical protein